MDDKASKSINIYELVFAYLLNVSIIISLLAYLFVEAEVIRHYANDSFCFLMSFAFFLGYLQHFLLPYGVKAEDAINMFNAHNRLLCSE